MIRSILAVLALFILSTITPTYANDKTFPWFVVADSEFETKPTCGTLRRDIGHLLALTCFANFGGEQRPIMTVVRQSVIDGNPRLRDIVLRREESYYHGNRIFD